MCKKPAYARFALAVLLIQVALEGLRAALLAPALSSSTTPATARATAVPAAHRRAVHAAPGTPISGAASTAPTTSSPLATPSPRPIGAATRSPPGGPACITGAQAHVRAPASISQRNHPTHGDADAQPSPVRPPPSGPANSPPAAATATPTPELTFWRDPRPAVRGCEGESPPWLVIGRVAVGLAKEV